MVRRAGTSLPVRTQEALSQAPSVRGGGPSAMRAQRCPSCGQGRRFQAVSQATGACGSLATGLRGPGRPPPRLSVSGLTFQAPAQLLTPVLPTAGKALEGAAEPSGGGSLTQGQGWGESYAARPAANTPPRKGAGGTLQRALLTQEKDPVSQAATWPVCDPQVGLLSRGHRLGITTAAQQRPCAPPLNPSELERAPVDAAGTVPSCQSQAIALCESR